MSRLTLNDGHLALLTATATLLLTLTTITDAVQVADSAELVTVACQAGVAHPPGYPLYTMLGHGLCAIPLSTPAARVTWLSLISAMVTAALLTLTMRKLGISKFSATLATIIIITAPLIWHYNSVAEVFSLNLALCVAALYASLGWPAQHRDEQLSYRQSWCVGLLSGLALTNHLSAIFILPAVLLAMRIRTAKQILISFLGVLLGLLPYLYLILVDNQTLPHWGQPETLPGFVHHLLRRDYGTFQLGLHDRNGEHDPVNAFFLSVPNQIGFFGVAVAMLGLFRSLSVPDRFVRRITIGWLAAFVLSGPFFISRFNLSASGIDLQVVQRFFLLPLLFVGPWIGRGIDELRNLRRFNSRTVSIIGSIVVLGWTGFHIYRAYPDADASSRYAVEDYAKSVLDSVEPHALILGQGDVTTFGIGYFQNVLKHRTDVQYVDVRLLLHSWYAQQLGQQGLSIGKTTTGSISTIEIIRKALQRGRAVYLTTFYNQAVQRAFVGYPIGPLWRIVASNQALPPLELIYQRNIEVFSKFIRRGERVSPDIDLWSHSVWQPHAATWQAIGQAAQRAKKISMAQDCFQRMRYWQ